ncbi:MAG: hypothetical protein LH702_09655 [Phormidesmis sp. CAN_BIN44]|nr:hypothetical protein [Phormidesmis sp. CAN_BIN44]
MGQRARKMAMEQFTVDVMTSQYEQLWKKVLSEERSPRLRVPRPQD